MTKKTNNPPKRESRFFATSIEVRDPDAGDAKDGGDALEPTPGAYATLDGYAALFNTDSENLGGFVERIAPGAFDKALTQVDPDVWALYEHRGHKKLGKRSNDTLQIAVDKKGLKVAINMPNTTLGRDVTEEVRSGLIAGMSFGFIALKDEWDEKQEPAVRTIKDLLLYEVSIVGNPAYPDTTIAKRSLEEHRAAIAPDHAAETRRREMQLRLAETV